MGLHIQMIGTGNAFAKKYYNNNAKLTANDYNVLIDCGITAPLALHQLQLSFAQIDGILITHLHADHIGGLEEAAFFSKFISKKKLKLFIPEKLISPLWEHALKAGMDDSHDGTHLHTYFDVVPLKEGRIYDLFPGIRVEIIQTIHVDTMTSYSLFLNERIFYSADMQFDEQLLQHVVEHRLCHTILHDCQMEGPETVHATLPQLLTLPAAMQQKIQLMHYGDNMEDYIGHTGFMRIMQQGSIYTYD